MRSHLVVLVVVAILLASVTASVSKMATTNVRSFDVNQSGAPTMRLLRTHHTVDGEERAITGLDNIIDPLKSAVSKVVVAVKLNKWLLRENSAADVLKKLKFNNKLDDALASPKLLTLDKYVDMFNKQFPDRQMSLLGTLTARYGDDAVAMALVTAKQADNKLTKNIVTNLQTQQLEGWLTSGQSVDDVFNILKLGDDGFLSMMRTQKLEALDDYIKLFNSKNPKESTGLFTALKTNFGGDGEFAILVSRAIDMPSTQAMKSTASKYQNILFNQWKKSNLDPDNVLSTAFKNVDERVLDRANSIVKQYETFYRREVQ